MINDQRRNRLTSNNLIQRAVPLAFVGSILASAITSDASGQIEEINIARYAQSIATPFASCSISKATVKDLNNKDTAFLRRYDPMTPPNGFDKVQVTTATTFTPEASAVYEKYKDDGHITWMPVRVRPRTHAPGGELISNPTLNPLETTGDMAKGNYSQNLYILKGHSEGTVIDLRVHSEILTFDKINLHHTIGETSCGQIVLKGDTWMVSNIPDQSAAATIKETSSPW